MKKKLVLGMAASGAFIGLALAAHYGTWNCSSCTLNGATPDYDTVTFIQTTVNNQVSRWNSGDTVTICNGTTCASYLMASVFGGIEGMQQVAKFPQGNSGGGGGGGDGGGSGGGGGGWGGGGPGGGGGSCGIVTVGECDPL